MIEEYDPKICPVCGKPNNCQNHYLHENHSHGRNETYNECWCFRKNISNDAYKVTALQGQNQPACICCDCLDSACYTILN